MKKLKTNMIKCVHCGEVIESKATHDMKFCSCGAVSVDGGLEYIRRSFLTRPEDDYEELSVYEDGEAVL